MIPVIVEVAKGENIRPFVQLSIAVVASQIVITASPVSAAVIYMTGVLEPFGCSYPELLGIWILTTFLGCMITSFIMTHISKMDLSSDPIYQERLKEGLVKPPVGLQDMKITSSAKLSVWIFLIGVLCVVFYASAISPAVGLIKPVIVLRDAILNLPEKFGYTVVDNDGFLHNDAVVQETTKKMVKEGEAWTADSIEELAKKMGLNPTALKKTVDEYNSYVDSKKDPIGKNERNLNHKIIKPPFWACYSAMSVHHTMGGVQINTKTQVLDDKGNVIPGLYAAGEVTGGIHGTNRVGANAVADIFTFGRIAGKNAAAESKK